MKRTIIFFVLAIAGLSFITAQNNDAPATEGPVPSVPAPESPGKPESKFEYEPIRKGDQYLRIGMGMSIPLFNLGSTGEIITNTKMNLGGTGAIGFSRFITSKIALGGEVDFAFNSTLGENLYFYLPLTFKATYVLVFDRIQVPLSLAVGGAFQTYNTTNYFGPIIKPEVAGYYQYSPDWSIGASVAWNVIPQWYTNSANNRTGNFLETLVSIRYHF